MNGQTWLDENNPPLPDQTFARPAQDSGKLLGNTEEGPARA
jgi:hypothetical protein